MVKSTFKIKILHEDCLEMKNKHTTKQKTVDTAAFPKYSEEIHNKESDHFIRNSVLFKKVQLFLMLETST